MVLGCYSVTKLPPDFEKRAASSDLPAFSSAAEVDMALENGYLRSSQMTPDYQLVIRYLVDGEWVATTVGRVLFNAILPDGMPFVNAAMGKGLLGDLVFDAFRTVGLKDTTEFLDRLKAFGFKSATEAGISVGMEDMEIPAEKREIIAEAQADVDRFTKAYQRGVISFGERYNKVIDAWTHANNDVADAMIKAYSGR